jgi:integrase
MTAVLLGCGLRRAEVAGLGVQDLQQREEHWVFADLVGKGGHVRTIPIPSWIAAALRTWIAEANISEVPIFRAINKAGWIGATGFSPKVIWGVVKQLPQPVASPIWPPPDLRRTCARLCHERGGKLEQIQFSLWHVSVQTTERYLGCKQRLRNAVNDSIGIEPDTLSQA